MKRPRFLVTNDDGILAHGIQCLVDAAESLGDVTVVAPDREQSGMSHSLTLLSIRPCPWRSRGQSRTPTD